MTRNIHSQGPCPLCGRITRAHSRLSVADIETTDYGAQYSTVICRDCAVAMVMRSEACLTRA